MTTSCSREVVDLSPFKRDLDELIHDFGKTGCTSFAGLKEIWRMKRFSFIFEACPWSNLGFFMQSLYSHCMGYVSDDASPSLSHRLGGLYSLYCLHETQPFKPRFHIYFTVADVRRLRELVASSRQGGAVSVAALVSRMLRDSCFLFGCVDPSDSSFTERIGDLTDTQNALMNAAHKRLLLNTPIERYLHLDMAAEIDLQGLQAVSSEYEAAKQMAVDEAGEVVDVGNIRHICRRGDDHVGDVVARIVDDWCLRKEEFYEKTGRRPVHDPPPQDDDHSASFALELENILT